MPVIDEPPPPPITAQAQADDYGMRGAALWVRAQFPYVPVRDVDMLVRGVASILYPHAAVAAYADMSDELAGAAPEVAETLDRAAAARLAEMNRRS